ncbi:hypothetical protein TPE_1021 [Treponema pedis str. T A4]|uniref:Uncharacterized protein n=1 Tax=Treponema pedis str. T A4 TaxID=1291379 RepID=S5ZLQ8_9SPIR|nr:hypothetical protein TPE_1021 [Treponema pedis str. T A4]
MQETFFFRKFYFYQRQFKNINCPLGGTKNYSFIFLVSG